MECVGTKGISVTLVEEDAAEAEEIAGFLTSQGFQVRDVARTDKDFRNSMACHPSGIAIIDLSLGTSDSGIRLMEWAVREHRKSHCVALSGNDAWALRALQAGASSYVPKDAGYLRELPAILRKVSVGECALPQGRATALVISHIMKQGTELKGLRIRSRITRQERNVLLLLRQGFSRAQAADKLNLSPYTIHAHLYSVLGKTSFRSVKELLENWGEFLLDGDGNAPETVPAPEALREKKSPPQRSGIRIKQSKTNIRFGRKPGLSQQSGY